MIFTFLYICATSNEKKVWIYSLKDLLLSKTVPTNYERA